MTEAERTLERLGWTEALAAEMPTAPGCEPARVSTVYATRVDVFTARGPRHAIVRGRALRDATAMGGIAVGDWVAVGETGAVPSGVEGPAATETELVVEKVLPRRTAFVRQAAGERAEPQAIAANVDVVFVVTSLEGDFNLRRLERYLVAIRGSGAEACIALSKADLAREPSEVALAASALAPTLLVSARTGQGLDELAARIGPGVTAALVGSSGVGKSALVNVLLGRDAQREGEVREHDRRGRHTTTRRSLFLLPGGGLLVDTPGMRELKPWQPDTGEDEVEDAFEDIAALAEGCRYRDCRHEGEPGCAVPDAVARGVLDGSRLASFRKLAKEREARGARQAEHAAEQKRRARAASAGLRRRLRDKGR